MRGTTKNLSAIKEVELFASPEGKNKTWAADTDGSGRLDTYLYYVRKTANNVLSVFCASRFVDAECILKVNVNCWN